MVEIVHLTAKISWADLKMLQNRLLPLLQLHKRHGFKFALKEDILYHLVTTWESYLHRSVRIKSVNIMQYYPIKMLTEKNLLFLSEQDFPASFV